MYQFHIAVLGNFNRLIRTNGQTGVAWYYSVQSNRWVKIDEVS